MLRTILMTTAMLAVAGCGGGSGGGGGGSGVIVPPVVPPVTPPAPPPPPSPPPTSSLRYDAAADDAIANGARAVIVIRAGAVVSERYGNGGTATRGEELASGTKSFACLLGAAAEDDGLLSIDELVGSTLSAWGPGGSAPQNPLKQQIRARDLLALSAGLSSTGAFGDELNASDSYAQATNATSRTAPNGATIYGPNSFQAFSLFFELKTGGRVNADGTVTGGRDGVSYLQSRVFDRIGIAPTAWARDIRGKPNFGGGSSMTAIAWARVGQLLEQNGTWNGAQVISAARLERCATYRSGAFQGYGLSLWLNRSVGDSYQPGRDLLPFSGGTATSWRAGGRAVPSAPEDMYFAAGAGPTRLYIVPSQDLVVARIGGTDDEDRYFHFLYNTAG